MKVRFLQAIAGHADERYGLDDFTFRPGEEQEIDDTLAASWIESGVAEAAESEEPKPKGKTEQAKHEEPKHEEHAAGAHHDMKSEKPAARSRNRE